MNWIVLWRVEFFKIGNRDFTFIREMRVLKYGFCKKYFDRNEPLNTFVPRFFPDQHWSEVHFYRSNFIQNPYFSCSSRIILDLSCSSLKFKSSVEKSIQMHIAIQGCRKVWKSGGGGGTVCSNGFYADIWSQHQMQQYEICLKSFLSNFGSSEVP